MGKFNYLLGKSEKIKIGDSEFEIKPLTARHLDLFMSASEGKENEFLYELVLASLQQTDEELTIEDVKELPLGVFNSIAEVVMNINELK